MVPLDEHPTVPHRDPPSMTAGGGRFGDDDRVYSHWRLSAPLSLGVLVKLVAAAGAALVLSGLPAAPAMAGPGETGGQGGGRGGMGGGGGAAGRGLARGGG